MFEKKKPIVMYRKRGLYLALTPPKGRGLFCEEDIAQDEVIEVAPVLFLKEDDAKAIHETLIANYTFSAEDVPPAVCKRNAIADPALGACLPMGIAAFCNGQRLSNATTSLEDGYHTAYFVLKATKPIPKGTEICVHYGFAWFTRRRFKDLRKAQERAGIIPQTDDGGDETA